MASRVALGTGSMKRADAKALQRRWERQAGRSRRRGVVDPDAVRGLGVTVDPSEGAEQ